MIAGCGAENGSGDQLPNAAGTDPNPPLTYRHIGGRDLAIHRMEPSSPRGDGPDRVLHKTETDARATLILFHGGGWNGGSPSDIAPVATAFAEAGFRVLSPEYRTKSRDGASPEDAMDDAINAVQHIALRPEQFGLSQTEPSPIVFGGMSVGGQMAIHAFLECQSSTASNAESLAPAGLVLFNPVLDLGPDGFAPDRMESPIELVSPIHREISGFAPTLIVQGGRDETTPLMTAMDFAGKLRSIGSSAEIYVDPAGQHTFFIESVLGTTGRTARLDVMEAAIAFLGRVCD